MCRWFTYLGLEDQLLEDVLLRPSHSIVRQIDSHFLPAEYACFDPSEHQPSALSLPSVILSSKTKARLQHPASANDTGSPNPLTDMDGFGLAWWTGAYEQFDSGVPRQSCSRASNEAGVGGCGRFSEKQTVGTRSPLSDLVLKSRARDVDPSVVAHARAGTGLTAAVETNCHPFTYGRHLFFAATTAFLAFYISSALCCFRTYLCSTRFRSLARPIRSTAPSCTFTA